MANDSTITVVGHLGKDPEVKFLNNGDAMVGVSVAVTPRVKKDNEWVDGTTTWYRVATFGPAGEALAEAAHKGDRVIVTGQFSMYVYEKDGVEKSIPEIKFATVGIVPKPQRKEAPREQTADAEDPWGPPF